MRFLILALVVYGLGAAPASAARASTGYGQCTKLSRDLQNSSSSLAPSNSLLGNFDGVPVSLPREVLEIVEYDKPSPAGHRSFARPIRSLSFRMPLRGLKYEWPSQQQISKRHVNTTVLVTVNGYSNYPGKKSVQNLVDNYVDSLPYAYKHAGVSHGLDAYRAVETFANPSLRRPYIYTKRAAAAEAAVFIKCSERHYVTATCEMNFITEPQLPAVVSVTFPTSFLPYWSDIKLRVSETFSDFCFNPSLK